MKWRVCKTITEYHYFVVDAESEQEAMDIVNNHDGYYCNSSDADDIVFEIQGAVEVKE
jgi:hypothetical protein